MALFFSKIANVPYMVHLAHKGTIKKASYGKSYRINMGLLKCLVINNSVYNHFKNNDELLLNNIQE